MPLIKRNTPIKKREISLTSFETSKLNISKYAGCSEPKARIENSISLYIPKTINRYLKKFDICFYC